MNYFLSIAASDNSGGAGIQQDFRVAESLGYWGLSAVTGITVQSFEKLYSISPIPAKLLKQQIELCINSFNIKAFKIGAVCGEENIKVISQLLKRHNLKNIVLDTVFSPTQGKAFVGHKSINLFKEQLLSYVDIITPNKDELSLLAESQIIDIEQGIEAAKQLAKECGCNIYLKGGHFEGNVIKEALISKSRVTLFEKDKLILKYSHGTGCAFSTALSCYLGKGLALNKSCIQASEFVSNLYRKINSDLF